MEHDDIDSWRALSPERRLAMALELSAHCWRWLDVPDADTGRRKLAAWQREHDLSNAAMLRELLARDREPESK